MISILWLHTKHTHFWVAHRVPSHLATDVSSIQVPREEEQQEGCLALHTDATKGKSQEKRESARPVSFLALQDRGSPDCSASIDVHCRTKDNFAHICPGPWNFRIIATASAEPHINASQGTFDESYRADLFPKAELLKRHWIWLIKKELEKTTFEVKKEKL